MNGDGVFRCGNVRPHEGERFRHNGDAVGLLQPRTGDIVQHRCAVRHAACHAKDGESVGRVL